MRFILLLNERTVPGRLLRLILNLQFRFVNLTSTPLLPEPLAPPLTLGSAPTTLGCNAFMRCVGLFKCVDVCSLLSLLSGVKRPGFPGLPRIHSIQPRCNYQQTQTESKKLFIGATLL